RGLSAARRGTDPRIGEHYTGSNSGFTFSRFNGVPAATDDESGASAALAAFALLGHRRERRRAPLLAEDPCHEALALADPLDLDGDRVDSLIEPRQTVHDFLRK